MSNIGNSLDGRTLLLGWPFRSLSFLMASTAGAGSIVLTAYILYQHWQTLTVNAALFLGIFIGIHLIYQWWRVLRCRAKIRELYLRAPVDDRKVGSPLDATVRIAVGGLIDLLFFSYGITLGALFFIEFLLYRLDGLK